MNYWEKRSKLEKILYIASFILALVVLSLIVSVSIISVKKSQPPFKYSTCQTNICKERGRELKRWINDSVNPCDDFYGHCCGGWLQENPLPKDTEIYSAFNRLEFEIAEDIRKLLEGRVLAKVNHSSHSMNQMLTFYNACLDTDSIEARGITPLLNFLEEIGGWPLITNDWNSSNYDWLEAISKLVQRTATGYLIRFIVSPDIKNTSNNIIQLDRPSLMIEAGVLLNSNDTTGTLEKYKQRIRNIALFLNASNDQLDNEVEGIIDFERNLAKMLTPNTENWYNKATIEEFQKKLPKFQLLRYLQLVTNKTLLDIGELISNEESIIIRDIQYLQNLTEFINEQPDIQRQIANYLGWRVIEKHGSHFPTDFIKVLQPRVNSVSKRWKFCVSLTNVAMGYVVTHAYIVGKGGLFNTTDVIKMVEKIKSVFTNVVQNAKWMDSKTKEEAVRKIKMMHDNIGYPNWVLSEERLDEFYKTMGEMGTDPFENDLTVAEYTSTQLMISLRQKFKFPEWNVNPLTVNAGYNHNENSITVPIAMLNSPFYDYGLPRYLNYARIGAVIGHEITHGFDTKGSERDADGNAVNWWTSESKQEFDLRASCFVQQYNFYGVNGEKTLAENIADNGGLKQAYLSYQLWKNEKASDVKLLPGFEQYSSDQLFFLSYCTMWCTHYSQLGWNVTLSSLHHSPSIFRVWGTVSNMKEFAKAFQCIPSKMNSEKKCSIW